jgi:ribonuclease Z
MMDFFIKHKQAFIVGAVVLVLLGIGGIWFLNNLPDPIIAMIFNRTISTNQTAKHFEEDALYVITTGTGAPLPDPGRAGPQSIVVAGEQVLVFDSGPGSTHKLELIMDASSVDALFLTHYHSDHIGDMGELMLKRWGTGGSAEPLPYLRSSRH